MSEGLRVKNTARLPIEAPKDPMSASSEAAGPVQETQEASSSALASQALAIQGQGLYGQYLRLWGKGWVQPSNVFGANSLTEGLTCPTEKQPDFLPLQSYVFPKIHPTRGFYTITVSLPEDKADFRLAASIAKKTALLNRLQNRPIKEVRFDYEDIGRFSGEGHYITLSPKLLNSFISFEKQIDFLLPHELFHVVYCYGLESHIKHKPMAEDLFFYRLYALNVSEVVDESSLYPTCHRLGHPRDALTELFASSMGTLLASHQAFSQYHQSQATSERQKLFNEGILAFYQERVDPGFKVWKKINDGLDPSEALPGAKKSVKDLAKELPPNTLELFNKSIIEDRAHSLEHLRVATSYLRVRLRKGKTLDDPALLREADLNKSLDIIEAQLKKGFFPDKEDAQEFQEWKAKAKEVLDLLIVDSHEEVSDPVFRRAYFLKAKFF
ncbi:MAG: hypothetical protein KDK66_01035 [Deltaproteobacteria bacterium]|nr:hypothetical protein [Deltaproteobacteria bacterium]